MLLRRPLPFYPAVRIITHMREIVQDGHPVLRIIAKEIPIEDIGSARIRELIAEMKSLLANEKYGVALAAPQVGEGLRLFIVGGVAEAKRRRAASKEERDPDDEDDEDAFAGMSDEDEVYINPVLVKTSRAKRKKHEGCLSVRGKWGHVPRAEKATVRAYNEKGEKVERGASGFLAHIFQHEMDHLDGVLYIDKAVDIHDADSDDE